MVPAEDEPMNEGLEQINDCFEFDSALIQLVQTQFAQSLDDEDQFYMV